MIEKMIRLHLWLKCFLSALMHEVVDRECTLKFFPHWPKTHRFCTVYSPSRGPFHIAVTNFLCCPTGRAHMGMNKPFFPCTSPSNKVFGDDYHMRREGACQKLTLNKPHPWSVPAVSSVSLCWQSIIQYLKQTPAGCPDQSTLFSLMLTSQMPSVFGWSNGEGQMLINAGRGVIMARYKRLCWIQGDAFSVILLKVLFVSQVVQQIGFDI